MNSKIPCAFVVDFAGLAQMDRFSKKFPFFQNQNSLKGRPFGASQRDRRSTSKAHPVKTDTSDQSCT